MMKHVSTTSLDTRLEESESESNRRYPGWLIGLIWLAVMAFGALFWAAVFLFAYRFFTLE